MREGWTYQNFEKCIEKVKYTTKIASSDFHLGSKYPIISQEEDYISGYWDKEEDVFHITKPVVIFGDHTRVLKYVDMDFVLGADGVKILQPIDNLNAKFLKYYLQAYQIPNLGYSRHYKILKDIDVPIPPLTIQQQIVSELDLLSHILDQKRQQLKEYDALAESIFYDMFGDPVENPKGWEVKTIGDISEVATGSTPDRKNDTFYGGSIPWVKTTEVANCEIFSTEETITEEGLKNSNCKIFRTGTILMAMYGQGKTRGQVAILRIDATTNQACAAIILDDHYETMFIYFQLRTLYNSIRSMAQGCNQANLNLSLVRKIRIILPPLSLQRSFAAKIESIEHQKQLLRASIKETEMLFQSRMDYWFNG